MHPCVQHKVFKQMKLHSKTVDLIGKIQHEDIYTLPHLKETVSDKRLHELQLEHCYFYELSAKTDKEHVKYLNAQFNLYA